MIKKQPSLFLIFIFILVLMPFGPSNAITQNQIDAEVQIVCPDNFGNWYSGSGTIIDPKGIILTNKHVVSDQYGNIINTCFIGFTEAINQEPNFGTQNNPNLAKTKYFSSTESLDVAILYLENLSNKTYPYINIWNSDSNSLKLGDKIEAIGFPSIGGATITYTSGDFSGFGSSSSGTQNYFKTTAPLEHGNSGGATYNSNEQFMGIPTMVIAGTLNSISYILSVNSIKNWLSGFLGQTYKQEVIQQKPVVVKPTVTLQEDKTPPNFNKLEKLCYYAYNEDNQLAHLSSRCFPKNLGKSEPFKKLKFLIPTKDLPNIDPNGLKKIYYYFDKIPHNKIDSNAKQVAPVKSGNALIISEMISFSDEGSYYFTFFGEDNKGNISNPYIYEYRYEPEAFKQMEELTLYKDTNNKYPLLNFNVSYQSELNKYEHRPLECKTRIKNLTVAWKYPENYTNFVAYSSNSWGSLISATIQGENAPNKYTIKNLNWGNNVPYNAHYWETTGYLRDKAKYFALYLKPVVVDNKLDYHHQIMSILYEPYLNTDIVCKGGNVFIETSIPTSSSSQSSFADKLKGKILLQVEEHGEAYYIYPNDLKKYYLGRPADAFDIMKKLGLGATHEFITSYTTYPNHVLGKILLDVEQHGEAYYIYPEDRKAYYLGRPADAFKIMRELGLGITNSDLSKIAEGNL